MRITTLFKTAVCTLALLGLGGGPALAGPPEDVPRGQTERGPENANSICSFSGLNDNPDAPFPEGGQVQSYGQIIRIPGIGPADLKAWGETPALLCNGHLMPWPEAFGGGH
ncbi:hypothetical protein ACFWIX_06955 [Pseudarthrobacter sp. NPDC058362]|uniref:hypothetical protein n=1 Tax=Pseudarthrobacter sp. NPDC058362 TaxID=3346458 RepID=UPI00365FE0AB